MTNKILRLPEVMEATGLSRSSIYAFVKQSTFPPPIHIGVRARGWTSESIQEWLEERAQIRDGGRNDN